MSTNTQNHSKTSVTSNHSLNLEELTMEYQNTLIKYNKVKLDYINHIKKLNNNTANISNNKLSLIFGKKFVAPTTVLDSSANNVEECKAICSSNSGCYGATFNSNDKTCVLGGSDGDIVKGSNSDFAIISQSYVLLKKSKSLNNKLIKINEQISNIIVTNKKTIFSNNKQSTKKSQVLVKDRDRLNEERAVIEQTLDEFKDLEENEVEGDLITNSNYYSFILLLFLVIVFILCLLFFSFTSKSSVTTSSNSGNQFSNLFNMK
jgi:hypothetical protein